MSLSYRICASGRGVITTLSGRVDLDEARSLWKRFLADPAPLAAKWELMDLRELEGTALSADALQELVALDREYEAAIEKVALVAPRPLSYGIARMYQGFAAGLPFECRVFRTMPEALEWVGIDPEPR